MVNGKRVGIEHRLDRKIISHTSQYVTNANRDAVLRHSCSHFQNAELKCEIKCDEMQQLEPTYCLVCHMAFYQIRTLQVH